MEVGGWVQVSHGIFEFFLRGGGAGQNSGEFFFNGVVDISM